MSWLLWIVLLWTLGAYIFSNWFFFFSGVYWKSLTILFGPLSVWSKRRWPGDGCPTVLRKQTLVKRQPTSILWPTLGGIYTQWGITQSDKEWNKVICCKMDGPRDCHTKWSKSDKYHILSPILMLLNCGVGEDSWESLGLQGDPTSPFWGRSALGFLWKEWC